MTHTAVPQAIRNQKIRDLRHNLGCLTAYHPSNLPRLCAGFSAQALVGDGHQLLSVAIENHVHRRVAGRLIAIYALLSVVAQGADVRLRVDVAGKMRRSIGRNVLNEKCEIHDANRGMSGVENAAQELRRRGRNRCLGLSRRNPDAALEQHQLSLFGPIDGGDFPVCLAYHKLLSYAFMHSRGMRPW